MQMQRTNSTRGMRRALTTAGSVVAAGGLMLATAGTASASTVVADSCTGTVQATSGDTIAVAGASMTDAVRAGAQEVKNDRAIPWLSSISPDDLANMIASEPQINVGQVTNRRETTVSGSEIGQQAVEKLENAGLWDKRHLGALIHRRGEVVDRIEQSIAEQCGLTVTNASHNTPGSSSPSSSSAGSTDSPGSTDSSGRSAATSGPSGAQQNGSAQQDGTNNGTAPPRDYSNIPEASVPSANMSSPSRMGDAPTAKLPQAPFPSANTNNQGNADNQSKVMNAGQADSLAQQPETERVQGPMLLAVVTLALATAGLVRSWVLRRA